MGFRQRTRNEKGRLKMFLPVSAVPSKLAPRQRAQPWPFVWAAASTPQAATTMTAITERNPNCLSISLSMTRRRFRGRVRALSPLRGMSGIGLIVYGHEAFDPQKGRRDNIYVAGRAGVLRAGLWGGRAGRPLRAPGAGGPRTSGESCG